MVWKVTLAAASTALLAPIAQLTHSGPTLEVSAVAWTGEVRSLAVSDGRLADPDFVAALRRTVETVCTPSNQSLRNAEREQACVAEVLTRAHADLAKAG